MAGEFRVDAEEQRELNSQRRLKIISEAADQRSDRQRPIGSKAVLNGKPVLWAGPDLEWQSPETFKKLETEGYGGDPDYLLKGGWQSNRFNLGINKALEVASPVLEPIATAAGDQYEQFKRGNPLGAWYLESVGKGVGWGLNKLEQGTTALSRAAGVHPLPGNMAIETIADVLTGPLVPTTALALTGRVAKVDNALGAINTAKKLGKIVYKNSDEWYTAAKKLHTEGLSAKQIRDRVGKFKDEATGQRWTIHQTGRGKGITRIDLDITRANREAHNLRRAQEQTGDYFNAYKQDRGLKEQARLLDSPEGRGQIHHMRPKVVIDAILHGSTGTEREILLSLSHDVFGGIGDTLGNMQVLSHRNHKIVHAMLKENGFDQSVMKLQNFEKLTGAQRIEALYDLREVVLEANTFVLKKRTEDLAQGLNSTKPFRN